MINFIKDRELRGRLACVFGVIIHKECKPMGILSRMCGITDKLNNF